MCLKISGWVANSVDPDEMPRSAASHLGLHCLLRPVCPNTYGKYVNYLFCLKTSGWVVNSVDPDQMLHSAASDLGLHSLLRPVCPRIKVIMLILATICSSIMVNTFTPEFFKVGPSIFECGHIHCCKSKYQWKKKKRKKERTQIWMTVGPHYMPPHLSGSSLFSKAP